MNNLGFRNAPLGFPEVNNEYTPALLKSEEPLIDVVRRKNLYGL